MAESVFYRKWRPQVLSDVIGQEHITQTLLNALKNDELSHAYLFCGPRGTGKTSTGRILAKAVNCLTNKGKGEPCNHCAVCNSINENRSMDIIEIDAASNTGVDDIRKLREKVGYAPSEAEYKVYIIDEVHMLSTSASNALLKTLEEPPQKVIFILATTEIHKVLPTVMSRCQRFDFRRIPYATIEQKLASICEAEGIKASEEALSIISAQSRGSLRDAENILQQISTSYSGGINAENTREILGMVSDSRVQNLAEYILKRDIKGSIETLNSVNDDGIDVKQFNRELVEYLHKLLLVKSGVKPGNISDEAELSKLQSFSADAPMGLVLSALNNFSSADFSSSASPILTMELAVMNTCLPREDNTISTIESPAAPNVETANETAVDTAVAEKAKAKEAPKVKKKAIDTPLDKPLTETESRQDKAEPKAEEEIRPASKKVDSPKTSETAKAVPPDTNGDYDKKLYDLSVNWKEILENAPANTKRTAAMAILRSAGVKPIALKDGTVTLSFKYSNHKDIIEKTENKLITQEILSSRLGFSCEIKCVYEHANNYMVKEAQKLGAQIISVEEK